MAQIRDFWLEFILTQSRLKTLDIRLDIIPPKSRKSFFEKMNLDNFCLLWWENEQLLQTLTKSTKREDCTFPWKTRKKKLHWDTFLRKSKTSSLKLFTTLFCYFQIAFPCKKEQKRKKGKSSERFSVTQTNFDNYTSLDVELMKENLTSLLEIDKIKWVLSLSLFLSFLHFLDYRNKRLFFNPVRCTAGG